MPEPVATPAASVARDANQTANNIVKGIQDRAGGKGSPPVDTKPVESAPVDPNAGKEKYVVEGKEVWLTPQERTAWIQKGMAFQPRMDQLARLAQEQQALTKALLSDPGKVLANLAKQNNMPMTELVQKVLKGNSSDEVKEAVGQWYYEEAVEPAKLTPEQRKAREDAKWRIEREQQDKLSQENMVKQENRQRVAAAEGQIKANIAEAMKESGLPDNNTPLGAEMAWMVAKVMQVAAKRRESMTPKQAIEIVKNQRIKAFQTAYYESLAEKDDDGESLSKELGEKVVKKLQKFLLKQAKGQGGTPPVVPNGRPTARNGERKTLNMDEFHDYLDNLKKQG